mmetsp:Transcript_9090/g.15890  ORF Transcript_9090/g.15890 Transcript_9090/m.15890 type:complete len:82 (+) Transcript_9090:44-289(+)
MLGYKLLEHWFFAAAKQGDVVELVKCLEQGVDPDCIDFEGSTALWYAAVEGHEQVVSALMDYGAQVHKRCACATTALISAT